MIPEIIASSCQELDKTPVSESINTAPDIEDISGEDDDGENNLSENKITSQKHSNILQTTTVFTALEDLIYTTCKIKTKNNT